MKCTGSLRRHTAATVLIGVALLAASVGHAQSEGSDGGGSVEIAPLPPEDEKGTSASTVPGEMDAIEQLFVDDGGKNEVINDGQRNNKVEAGTKAESELKGVSDLTNLAAFKDVAMIQKRYLPKSGRFEAFGGGHGILNDKFFVSIGANARLAYYFTERMGLEMIGAFFATGEKSVTADLKNKRGVRTTNFVSPQSFYGLDFKWTPVYGKMSFLNKKITPFDLYFSGGLGMTNTNQGGSEPTFHVGTGQIFAFNKTAAFRWDFSWNFYNAKSGVAGAQQNAIYNNLFLTVGLSFFFPEATYR